jgi:hypothetical protein
MSAPKRGSFEAIEAIEGPTKRARLDGGALGPALDVPAAAGAPALAAAEAAPPAAGVAPGPAVVKDEQEGPAPQADTAAPDQVKLECEPTAWADAAAAAPPPAAHEQPPAEAAPGDVAASARDAPAAAADAGVGEEPEGGVAPADACIEDADAEGAKGAEDAVPAEPEATQTQAELQSAATAALKRLLQPVPGAAAPLAVLSPREAGGGGLPPPPPGARQLLPQALLQQLASGAPAPRGTAPVGAHAVAASGDGSGPTSFNGADGPGSGALGDGAADAAEGDAPFNPKTTLQGRSGRRPKPPAGSSAAQRLQRRKNTSPSTSSYKGVTRHRRTGRWEAHVSRRCMGAAWASRRLGGAGRAGRPAAACGTSIIPCGPCLDQRPRQRSSPTSAPAPPARPAPADLGRRLSSSGHRRLHVAPRRPRQAAVPRQLRHGA